MSRKKADLTVKVGEYQKDGQTKGKYENVGALMEDPQGREFLLFKRTFNPAGVPGSGDRDSILVSIFHPQDQGQGGGQQRPQGGGYAGGGGNYGGGYQNQNAGGSQNQRQQQPPPGQQNMNYGGGGNYQAPPPAAGQDNFDDDIPF